MKIYPLFALLLENVSQNTNKQMKKLKQEVAEMEQWQRVIAPPLMVFGFLAFIFRIASKFIT